MAFAMNMSAGADASAEKPAICKGCGREGGPINNCNENGRVLGGVALFLPWWPIKAYRPCPDFIKAEKTYTRAGQSLEEIAFGRKAGKEE